MRKFLVIFLIAFVGTSVSGQNSHIDLIADYWPPFTNHPNEIAFAQSLVYEALSRADFTVSTEIVPFEEVLNKLQQGESMGSPALWYSDDRADYLHYSVPYLENRVVLIGRKGADVSAEKLNDLAGKKVAIVKGYAYGDLQGEGIEPVEGIDQQACLTALLKGDADYMLVDALLVNYVLQRQGEEFRTHLAVGENVLIRRSVYFTIRRDLEGGEEIIGAFNERIEEMQYDGTYNRILQLYSIQTDVDGDGHIDLVMTSESIGGAPMMSSDAYKLYHEETMGNQGAFYVDGQRFTTVEEVTAAHGHNPQSLKAEQDIRGDKTGVYLWNFDL